MTTAGEYEADLVILCVGFRPNTDLVKGQVDMLPNGAIVVDEYMQTSKKIYLRPEIAVRFTTIRLRNMPIFRLLQMRLEWEH